MTPEAQRIAIAEACGIKCAGCGNTGTRTKFGKAEYARIRASNPVWSKWPEIEPDIECHHNELPDYLNSLDAMHDVEKMLTEEQAEAYFCHLRHTFKQREGEGIETYYIHATATQRAEAFLHTIGKWKEGA